MNYPNPVERPTDLWESWSPEHPVVITTNGAVRLDGAAVMGRGCAREAKERFPDLPYRFGMALKTYGNRVLWFPMPEGKSLITFPVKHHWADRARPELIRRSFRQLWVILRRLEGPDGPGERFSEIHLPRPGCGNGGLDWDADVRPLAETFALREPRAVFHHLDGKDQ